MFLLLRSEMLTRLEEVGHAKCYDFEKNNCAAGYYLDCELSSSRIGGTVGSG